MLHVLNLLNMYMLYYDFTHRYLFYTYVFFEIRSDSLFKWVLAALFFHLWFPIISYVVLPFLYFL